MLFQLIGETTTVINFCLLVQLVNSAVDSHGPRRCSSCSTQMTNSTLVQQCLGKVMPRTICHTTQRQFYTSTKTRGAASSVVETTTSDRKGVREVFLSQGF